MDGAAQQWSTFLPIAVGTLVSRKMEDAKVQRCPNVFLGMSVPMSPVHSGAQPTMVRTLGGWRAALSAPPLTTGFPPPRFFTQKLDHFAEEPRTWQQAFFVNDSFWKAGGPVFLCVGGEGPPLTGAAVSSSVHCNVAVEHLQEFGALMLALEHRYYGCHNASACPYTTEDAEPLRWLSSRQALADIATLHAHMTSELKLPPSTRWVTFGGSYPGMLASWARLLYPKLIHASISSSAPAYAKLDMPEYNDLVARAFSLPSVGGSDECRQTIAAGHATIGRLMQSAFGRAVLVSKFATLRGLGAAWLEPRSHRADFAGGGVASFPAQSNDPSCDTPGCSIGKICALLAQAPGSAVDKLATLSSAQLQAGLIQPHPRLPAVLPAGALVHPAGAGAQVAPAGTRGLDEVDGSSAPGALLDHWGYQTCTEFGFYQTCESGSGCFFTQGLIDLNASLAFCGSDFGISRGAIADAIGRTNARYGGLRPDLHFGAEAATRIMYVNGDVDPWSALSILSSPAFAILPNVSGASHHFWTHPTKPTDQKSVIEARLAIVAQLRSWLAWEPRERAHVEEEGPVALSS